MRWIGNRPVEVAEDVDHARRPVGGHDEPPGVDGAVVAPVREVDRAQLLDRHRAARPPGRVEVARPSPSRSSRRTAAPAARRSPAATAGRGGGGRGGRARRRAVVVVVVVGVVGRRGRRTCVVVRRARRRRTSSSSPLSQRSTSAGSRQHQRATSDAGGPSRRSLAPAPLPYGDRRMAAIEREWVALTSPTSARAGHGPHPCQGLYHRPAGAAADGGVHRHALQRRLLRALPGRAAGRAGHRVPRLEHPLPRQRGLLPARARARRHRRRRALAARAGRASRRSSSSATRAAGR